VKYIGPFKILKQTSPVDYIVEFKGHRQVNRLIHVNLLKGYVERTEHVNFVDGVNNDDCRDYSYVIQPSKSSENDELLNSKLCHLKGEQKDEMIKLLT
jgi:translation initiation factor IF-3